MPSMRKRVLIVGLLIASLSVLFIPLERVSASAQGAPSPYDLIAEVNALRRNNGLAELNTNVSLMVAAQNQSDYLMDTYGTNFPSWEIGHVGAGGTYAKDRAAAAGYPLPAGTNVIENWAGARSTTPLSNIIYNFWSDEAHWNTMTTGYGVAVGAGVTERDGIVYYILNVGVDYSIVPGSGDGSGSGSGYVPTTDTTPQVVPVQVATPLADGSIIHTVQKGQALWSIAINYGTTVDAIRSLNSLSANAIIYEGQELMIRPPSTPTPTATITMTPRPATRTPIPPQTPQDVQSAAAQEEESGAFLGGLGRQTIGLILVGVCGLGLAVILFTSFRKEE